MLSWEKVWSPLFLSAHLKEVRDVFYRETVIIFKMAPMKACAAIDENIKHTLYYKIHKEHHADEVGKTPNDAPNDTAYKRWSCHSGFKLLCKLCRTSPPAAMGADLPFLGMLAMRTRWMAGAAAH